MKITQLLLRAAVQPPRSPAGDGPLAGTGGEQPPACQGRTGQASGFPARPGVSSGWETPASGLPTPCVHHGSARARLFHALSSRDVLPGVPAHALPSGHPQPPETQIQGGLPLLPLLRAWSGWDRPSITVAAVHPKRDPAMALRPRPSLAALPFQRCEPCGCQPLPAPAYRQRGVPADGEPALCLPLDTQAPALAVGPTACDFHKQYSNDFARNQHSSLNCTSAVKILANLQRAFFFPKLFITP